MSGIERSSQVSEGSPQEKPLAERIIERALGKFISSPQTFIDNEGKVKVYDDKQALRDVIQEEGIKPVDLFVSVTQTLKIKPDAIVNNSDCKNWNDFCLYVSWWILEDEICDRICSDPARREELLHRWDLIDQLRAKEEAQTKSA